MILLGVIDLKIPASYIITFAVFMFLFGAQQFDINYVVAELCGGGLMLGAFFMATDYVTSPITPMGKIIFGICCGILTGVFRLSLIHISASSSTDSAKYWSITIRFLMRLAQPIM